MNPSPYDWIERSLETIQRANWHRSPRVIDSLPGVEVTIGGRRLLNFGSNDYLGLAGDERTIAAAVAATQAYGTGATGSRLTSGHKQLHRDLELAIARLKGTEDAIVFSSGYLANIGTIGALVGSRDVIIADRDNHSSLKHGASASGAQIYEYDRRQLDELARHLQSHRDRYRRCLIITDTVFSMDGDICALPEIMDLADRYRSMVLVDEAHATGVFGTNGAGVVEHYHCRERMPIAMGTLSKALGSLGGYVAGSSKLIDFLRNRCASWIYTTGLSPADTAAALAAIDIVANEPARRQQLWDNVNLFKQLIGQQATHLRPIPSDSPILCIELPDARTALAASAALDRAGIFAPAIRPPTVPTSRIRITLMATHHPTQIERLVAAIADSSPLLTSTLG